MGSRETGNMGIPKILKMTEIIRIVTRSMKMVSDKGEIVMGQGVEGKTDTGKDPVLEDVVVIPVCPALTVSGATTQKMICMEQTHGPEEGTVEGAAMPV